MKAIAFLSGARRAWRNLPPDVRDRIRDKLDRYAASGEGDVRVLKGREGARLRVGDYRVIFVETGDVIEVHAVGHRADVYH